MASITPEKVKPMDAAAKEKFVSEQPWFFRLAYRTGEMWRNRPSMLEMHFYYAPLALMAGSLAIGTADETLHLRLAHTMANVRVDKHDGYIERTFESAIHTVGVEAQKDEK